MHLGLVLALPMLQAVAAVARLLTADSTLFTADTTTQTADQA